MRRRTLPRRALLLAVAATVGAGGFVTAPAATAAGTAAPTQRAISTKPVCSTTTATPGVTKRARYVWKRLRAAGYSAAASAGVLGNLDHLSAISPTAVALTGSSAGLVRWTTPRWREYKAWAANRTVNPWTLSAQTTYLLYEMASDPGTFDHDKFQAKGRARNAAVYFHENFRRTIDSPATVDATRGAKASQWYQTLAATPGQFNVSDNSTYGLLVACDPPNATLDACPAVPLTFQATFGRWTGLTWTGLSANAQRMSRCVYAHFPRISIHGTYYGHMPDWQHAIDFMMPGGCRNSPMRTTTEADFKLGSRLARYLFVNGKTFGIDYLIWQDRLRNPVDHSDENGWAPVSQWRRDNYNNGNCTNTHFDHVHASVNY